MSGHNHGGRFVVADLRRRWTLAEKRSVVEETFMSSRSISAVARKHGIAPALLFRWRRELATVTSRSGGTPSPPQTHFVPVCLSAPDAISKPPMNAGFIEIELMRHQVRLRVDAQVDAVALKRIVDVLVGR